MDLRTGSQLGPYIIQETLGKGGMGEVYRANDPRIGRDVAIKLLAPEFAEDTVHLRRFEQEARAAGSLNHPNIVVLHDVGTNNGSPYLVTEFLEGETLRNRLSNGPLSAKRALEYSIQITRGLAAAHEKGVVHRDLKPENIFITKDGRIKILDFGLAKLMHPIGPLPENAADSPGHIHGTVGYMSPEQVDGGDADDRSDIFSFGTILFEMLSGKKAFSGETPYERINAILIQDPPDLKEMNPSLPGPICRIARRCLEKNPEERFQSMLDLNFALEAISEGPGTEKESDKKKPKWSLVAALSLISLIALLGLLYLRRKPETQKTKTSTATIKYLTFSGDDSFPSISPDGRFTAFISERDGQPKIWLKEMAGGNEVALTSGRDQFPRFSPDGSTILFVRQEPETRSLYKVSLLGGEPLKILNDTYDADWSPDGKKVVFVRQVSENQKYFSVIAIVEFEAGITKTLTQIDNRTMFQPRWSPDGRHISVVNGDSPGAILLIRVEDSKTRWITLPKPDGSISTASWSDPDHLIYLKSDSITPGVIVSPGIAVRHNIHSDETDLLFSVPNWGQSLDITKDNRVVFTASASRQSLWENSIHAKEELGHWLTRGNSSDRQPSYSPDGEWVTFSSSRSGNLDIWKINSKSGALRRLTEHPSVDWDPAFTRDGKHIVWSSSRSGHFEIWISDPDGSGIRQLSSDGVDAQNPTPTADGQWIIYASSHPQKSGIWKVKFDGSQSVQMWAGNSALPEISWDSNYVAFAEDLNITKISVLRIADGTRFPFVDSAGSQLVTSLITPGRSRWVPKTGALAFISHSDDGLPGIFQQDFEPGRNTSNLRKLLVAFDSHHLPESFGISPDGSKIVISRLDLLQSLMIADLPN